MHTFRQRCSAVMSAPFTSLMPMFVCLLVMSLIPALYYDTVAVRPPFGAYAYDTMSGIGSSYLFCLAAAIILMLSRPAGKVVKWTVLALALLDFILNFGCIIIFSLPFGIDLGGALIGTNLGEASEFFNHYFNPGVILSLIGGAL